MAEINGSAEFASPYDALGNIKIPDKEAPHQEHFESPILSENQGLSVVTKLVLFAIIVGVCFAYIKAHSPRRTAQAGRHGAYEKGGLP